MQIFLTIISGVAVFVFGQIILKTFIDPIQEQRRVIGRIIFATLFYSHDPADIMKAHEVLRQIMSDLLAASASIPFYPTFEFCHLVWKRDTINRVILEMRGWEGMTDAEVGKAAIRRIRAILNVKFGLPKDQEAVEKMHRENDQIVRERSKEQI